MNNIYKMTDCFESLTLYYLFSFHKKHLREMKIIISTLKLEKYGMCLRAWVQVLAGSQF